MFVQALKNGGIPEDKILSMAQTFATYNEPFKRLLGALASGKFVHDGDPVLEWMASNVAHKGDASGNIRPDKDNSGSKIDGISAGLMGTALMIASEPQRESAYESRGLFVLSDDPTNTTTRVITSSPTNTTIFGNILKANEATNYATA